MADIDVIGVVIAAMDEFSGDESDFSDDDLPIFAGFQSFL